MERDCHAAARSRARTALEILSNRVVEESNVKLEKTIFEIAMERARSGAPLENEPEKRGACWPAPLDRHRVRLRERALA